MELPAQTLLDRLISQLSPAMGVKRMRARAMLAAVERARRFEAALLSRRTSGWVAGSTSQNAEVRSALVRLRNRSRDLQRNNGWARRAVGLTATNMVGAGIHPKPLVEGALRDNLAAVWKDWAGTTACDLHGCYTFAGLQEQMAHMIADGGEGILRFHFVQDPNLPVPLQLELLESDHIDSTREGMLEDGGRVIQGVEVDERGRRRALYLYPNHPGDTSLTRGGFAWQSQRVEMDDMLHVFRCDRVGQLRGVPWLASVMLRIKDWDEYTDAQLLRQKIAAMFVGFVVDPDAKNLGPPAEGSSAKDPREQVFEPGTWEILDGAKSVEFSNPPVVQGFQEYGAITIREIAAGLDLTYEALSGDLSRVNFSSGRMGWIEMHRAINARQQLMFIPRVCVPVWQRFLLAADLSRTVRGALGVQARWSVPKREMLDPVKETTATIKRIRAGLTSLPAELRAEGTEPDELMKEIAEHNELLDELALVLESDPRLTAAAGAAAKDVDEDTAAGEGRSQGGWLDRTLAAIMLRRAGRSLDEPSRNGKH